MKLRWWRGAALLLLTAWAAWAELRVGRAALKFQDVSAAAEELYVKALVLDDGETRAAILVCDLPALDPGTAQAARQLIAAQAAIPEANIMIAATGTHAAAEKTPRGAAVAARLAEAVRVAWASPQPASVWAGAGREDATGFYNRFLMKDGTVRASPGKMNPDIVQPAGEADPDLSVVRFESASGQTLALFGSYSLRPAIVEGAHLSADYPGVIARTLGKLHGPELVTLWSTGAGANVTHIDVRSPASQASGAAEAQRVGTILAGEAIKACARASRVQAAKLGVVRESVRLAAAVPGRPPLEVEVQVIALGDSVSWVGLPGELWSELGTAIRKASPFPHTILTGLANAPAGVLPNRKGYAGNTLDPGVRAAAGSGETIADAAVRLLAAARRLTARQ